jgi:hypothetical protein
LQLANIHERILNQQVNGSEVTSEKKSIPFLHSDCKSAQAIYPQFTITSSTKIQEGEPAALCQAGAVAMFFATTLM